MLERIETSESGTVYGRRYRSEARRQEVAPYVSEDAGATWYLLKWKRISLDGKRGMNLALEDVADFVAAPV